MGLQIDAGAGRRRTGTSRPLEIDLLLEGVFRHYGYDFRGYARSSLRRRLHGIMQAEGLTTLSGLQERILHDARPGIASCRASR